MSDWKRSLCPNRFSPKKYFFRDTPNAILLDAYGSLLTLTIPPFICEALSDDIITVFSGIFSVIISLCGVKMVNTEVFLHWPFSSLRHLASLHSPLPSPDSDFSQSPRPGSAALSFSLSASHDTNQFPKYFDIMLSRK